MEKLRRLLLVVVIATGLMLAPTKPPAYAAPQPPPISYQQAVVEKFANAAGGEVVYRRGWHAGGGSGFGYDKITRKHGINNVQIVRAVVRYPQVTRQETQTRWVQEKQALLMGLSGVSQTLTVRVVIEYGGWAGPGQLGVVTAYCVGIQGRCPDWVNRAFAID